MSWHVCNQKNLKQNLRASSNICTHLSQFLWSTATFFSLKSIGMTWTCPESIWKALEQIVQLVFVPLAGLVDHPCKNILLVILFNFWFTAHQRNWFSMGVTNGNSCKVFHHRVLLQQPQNSWWINHPAAHSLLTKNLTKFKPLTWTRSKHWQTSGNKNINKAFDVSPNRLLRALREVQLLRRWFLHLNRVGV